MSAASDRRAILSIANRSDPRGRIGGYPSSVDWFPASGPVRHPSTVPTAPHSRDPVYQAALLQQQRDGG